MSEIPVENNTVPKDANESTMIVKITTDKSGPKLVCPICNKALISLNGYVKHMKKHEPPGGYICTYCDDRFCLEDHLKKHKDEKHKVLACQICHATFSNADEYREHIKEIHNGVDRNMSVCDKCGMEFKTVQAAKRHVETQCGKIKPHKCDECTLAFYTKYNLAEHKKIHRGEKKFCCSYCGKSFLNNGRLIIHERSHTGEKPYKCDVCGKCFAHRESIVTHSSIHTGIKLVVCKCCGARFSCHSNLIKHRRTRPDTCGQSIYDATKEKKRNGSSRIPACLMSSEIKIVRASKVINPNETQTKIKTDKSKTAKPECSTDDEEEINKKKPIQNNEDHKEDLIEPVDIKEKTPEPFEEDFQTDTHFNDSSFQTMSSEDSCEPTILETKSTESNLIKKENEENPFDVTAFVEKEDLLNLIPLEEERKVEIKDEPIIDIKEESPDTKPDIPLIKPCRVVIESNFNPFTFQPLENPCKNTDISKKKRKRSALRNSLKLFKKECIFNCKFCMKVYHIKKPYETHLRNQHNKSFEEIRLLLKEQENDIPDGLVHRCPICSKIYLMAKRLKTHITFHGVDGKLIHRCPCYCQLYFGTKEEAIEHAQNKHKNALYCAICNKYLQTPEALKTHKRSHYEKKKIDRNLMCEKCAKSFASRTSLNDHTRSNCGANPLYKCNVCGKHFSTAGILKTHSLLHKDDTPYMCSTCGKTFKIKAQYRTHIKLKHTDLKPFKCELCPKEYPYRESLLTHMTVHTGLKRYACNGCSKRFTCISNLQAHRKVYADTCGLQPLNSKPCQYLGVQKGMLLVGTKPTY